MNSIIPLFFLPFLAYGGAYVGQGFCERGGLCGDGNFMASQKWEYTLDSIHPDGTQDGRNDPVTSVDECLARCLNVPECSSVIFDSDEYASYLSCWGLAYGEECPSLYPDLVLDVWKSVETWTAYIRDCVPSVEDMILAEDGLSFNITWSMDTNTPGIYIQYHISYIISLYLVLPFPFFLITYVWDRFLSFSLGYYVYG